MSLDFKQLHQQVKQLGENAVIRQKHLQNLRVTARELLNQNAERASQLRKKVLMVARNVDPDIRCALPLNEALNTSFPLPDLPNTATVIAADGSQINPNRHAEVNYCVINVGAIQMSYSSSTPPRPTIYSELLYDEKLYTPRGMLTEGLVALTRDLNERQVFVELAKEASENPVITFTDGPMELWGAKEPPGSLTFQESLHKYLKILTQLQKLNVITAGYVDKPSADLVIRLLEVAMTPEPDLENIRTSRPLRGVTDRDLFAQILSEGKRSAMFSLQSKSAKEYSGPLALHFFYLNVGQHDHGWIVRVEIPAWVAEDATMLEALHAILIHQCRILGGRAYPYLLHRAHEVAVVHRDEKEQLTQMIIQELRRRGVQVGEKSQKQAVKDLPGRTSYG
ncbi:MAG: DNA double-strand break repair nuclease NurA [Chloroflexota bacterium]